MSKFIILFSFLSFSLNASTITIENNSGKFLGKVCDDTKCRAVPIRGGNYIEDGHFEELLKPYEGLIFIGEVFSGVNMCGQVYRFDEPSDSIVSIKNSEGENVEICNLIQSGKYIVSKERESALDSYESVWLIDNSEISLKYQDKIVGEYYIQRTQYDKKFLVSHNESIFERKRIYGKIREERSYFYDDKFVRTNKYVIKSDTVDIVSYVFNEQGEWVFSEFNGVKGYLIKSSLFINDETSSL